MVITKMAIKSSEVKHMILSQTIDDLNKTVAKVLDDGWELKECRLQQADYHNGIFTVFYIFCRVK